MHEFIQAHVLAMSALLGTVGSGVGLLLALFSAKQCRKFRTMTGSPEPVEASRFSWVIAVTPLLFVAYFVAVFDGQTHASHEVRPDVLWVYGRAIGHLILIALLVAATATDLVDFIIPDEITVPGTLLGLLLATASGDTQIMHLWVDWNDPMVELYGPWIPEWIKVHQHWHGLAWSMAGLIVGGGITWLARSVSGLVLGQESLGFGDVTLMAMIGSFIGWQPVLFVFLLAALCGLVIGLSVRALTNRQFVPYGPYLSLAAFLVLVCWKWLWQLEIPRVVSIRRLFGDGIGLGILAGIAVTAFVVLLVIVRMSRLIPGKSAADDPRA